MKWLGVLLLMAVPAEAHDWYGQMKRADGGSCCGGSDCAKLTVGPGTLEAVEDGIRVQLTAAEAQTINKYRTNAFDAVIPWDKIQPSLDGNYHICLMAYGPLVAAKGGWYCFFIPPNG